MTIFTVSLEDANDTIQPTMLRLTPQRWSAMEMGGMDRAEIAVAGPVDRLADTFGWLNWRVYIYSENGQLVWYGFVDEVELRAGGILLRKSLAEMANTVRVAYTYQDGTGHSQRGTTSAATNAVSIAAYGTRETLLSLADSTGDLAEDYRDQALALLAEPALHVEPDDGSQAAGAILYCSGFWHKLSWTYYDQDEGLEEYDSEADTDVPVAAEYTATTISFASADNVEDSANGLAWADPAEGIFISGSSDSDNNGAWDVDDAKASKINVDPDNIDTVAAGDAVTISRGSRRVTKIGQSFQIAADTAWTAYSVALLLRVVGSPTDNVTVKLCQNSAGSPGAVIETANVAASTLDREQLAWTELGLAGTSSLAASTTYWLTIERSGTSSPWNYFIVGASSLASYARGECKLYNGASWAAASPALDLPFRILGKAETTAQVSKVVTDNGNFVSTTIQKASGRYGYLYRDGDRISLEEIRSLLTPGASDDTRLLAWVTPERRIVIQAAPVESDAQYIYRPDGLYIRIGNSRVEPGLLLYGVWIELDTGAWDAAIVPDAVYVARSEYDANTGRLIWQTATPGLDAIWGMRAG